MTEPINPIVVLLERVQGAVLEAHLEDEPRVSLRTEDVAGMLAAVQLLIQSRATLFEYARALQGTTEAGIGLQLIEILETPPEGAA
jgi:hypothetical protein